MVAAQATQAQLHVILPHRRHLVLDGSTLNSCPSYLLAIVSSMGLPNLESLVIVSGRETLRKLFTQITSSLALLKRLELWDTSCCGWISRTMRSIAILHCLHDAAPPVPWPNLPTLTIEIEIVDDDAMSENLHLLRLVLMSANNLRNSSVLVVVIARERAGVPTGRLNYLGVT